MSNTTNSSYDFCRDPFYNATLSWETNNPSLTECMRDTLLTVGPALVYLLLAPPWLIRCYFYRQGPISPSPPRRLTLIFWLKHIILAFLTINALLELYTRSVKHNHQLYPSEILGPCCLIACYITSAGMVVLEKMWRSHTSPPQFVFWLLLFLCSIPTFKSEVEYLIETVDWQHVVLASTFLPFILIQLILHSMSDLDQKRDFKDPPELTASFFSLLFFNWFDPLVRLGFSSPLKQNMLPTPPPWVNVRRNVMACLRRWNNAVVSTGVDFSKADKKRKVISLWPVLFRTYWPRCLLAICFGLTHHTLTLVNPYVMKLLVQLIQNGDQHWKGYFYAVCMLGSSIVWTIAFHQLCQQSQILAIQMRSSAVGMIYRKSIKLSNKARRNYTVGEITNHMSVDAQRIGDSLWQTTNIWAAPYVIIISMYFIYLELGNAMFSGVAVMIILIPVNFIATKIGEKLEKKQLENKDERLKVMSEILNGMKVLKLYAWEHPFIKRVTDIRDREVTILKTCAKIYAIINFTFSCTPILTALAVFTTYVLTDPINHVLTADKIFVTIAYFNVMRLPIVFFPWSLVETIKLVVSINRIGKFLNSDELNPNQVKDEVRQDHNTLEISNCNFSWADEEEELSGQDNAGIENEPLDPTSNFMLKDINLDIPQGSLTAIVGVVGSGKSSLLSAILGNMTKHSGNIGRVGKIAYVPQQAWIQNLSVKDNILFEQEFNKRKYERTIDACALKADLEILSAGDKTEIGENGINLSGGQKQRISVARAVYSEADIYLLDDPLSAVDAHVGKHMFEHVIGGRRAILKGRTRLLVTHSVSYLEHMDQIIVMKEGQIAERGSYQELLDSKGAFSEFLLHYKTGASETAEKEIPAARSFRRSISEQSPTKSLAVSFQRQLSDSNRGSPICGSFGKGSSLIEAANSVKSLLAGDGAEHDALIPATDDILATVDEVSTPATGQLIEEEEAMEGKVKMTVYIDYIRTLGPVITIIVFFLYISGIGCHTAANYTLSLWADANDANITAASSNTAKYLGIVATLGFMEAITDYCRELSLFLATASAAKIIHNRFLGSVMRSPMSFFDTHPNGRILNRFSADVDTVDQAIPFQLSDMIYCACEVLYILLVICYSTPMFLTVLVPLFLFYVFIQKYYITTSRQLKRLESISKSPIFSHFSESVTGVTSIRAFKQSERFISQSEDRVIANVLANYPSSTSNRWLACRIETLGNIIVFFSAFFSVLAADTISPGLAALSITYSLMIVDTLNWLVRMMCDLETNAVSLERIKEYTDNKREADWDNEENDKELSREWPEAGAIKFEDYETRYREGLDLVLKGVDLKVDSTSNIGICGRTGAGKSSLTLALFRIIEPTSGKITIDGVDITSIGLHKLRSRLTIIPQDPVLFTGNLRFNLDPSEDYSDREVWRALEHAHLKDYVTSLAKGLDHEISEGGENFSVGQRQLICLARALLRKTKILILDEATAAVDLETDDLIQATIRKEFSDCTVITIAHRLNTIMDSCQIAVLSDGKLAEMGKPQDLVADKTSALHSMAKNAGIINTYTQK